MDKTEPRIISNALYFEEVQRLLDEGKEVCIRVKGNSMLPFIKNGDRVLLQAYGSTPLLKGANVLAKHEGKFVFHRYVGEKNGQMALAGDGNIVLHEYVPASHILAIATKHYTHDGDLGKNINSGWHRRKGMLWYRLRIIRRICVGLKRRLLS
jgi:signal peptidase I